MRKIFALFIVLICMTSKTSCYGADNIINLTENEKKFIEKNPVISLGVDPKFVPFEFIDIDDQYKGIAADYLLLISEKTGIQFEVVKGLTWPEAYDLALMGGVDVLPSISKTDGRKLEFLFSEPYYFSKRVIVTKDSEKDISGIQDLEGQTVAVQRNSSHHSYLSSKNRINLSLYDSTEAALSAVENGSERFFMGNIDTTNYFIRSIGLTNLKFVVFEAEKQQALYFAVRKDMPELVSIFNKALHTITEEEKFAINNKWIYLEQETDYSSIIRIISVIGVFVAVVMSVSFYWIVLLNKEIQKRNLIQIDLEKAKLEADEANNYKSEFMARMSHEIRTPLNAIMGMAYLLNKSHLAKTQRVYIERINKASSTMLNIINDILDLSKIESGKMELEITTFSLDELIENVVNIVFYNIEERGIEFKLEKDPEIPKWFIGDSKRIEQVLLNILNNAAKFTVSGYVLMGIHLIDKENEKYHLSFSIKDTGIGLNEEQVNKIFEPFTQGDTSINRRFGGSGLGLSIVKNLIDLMGGQIQVFSSLGEGTTFVINLSLNVDKEKENDLYDEIAISEASHEGQVYVDTKHTYLTKRYSVLVVDDNSTNQLLAKSFLKIAGLEPIFAANGKEAIEVYKEHKSKIALILMDLHMPVMNGYEAAQEIIKISDSVPIVAMTADVVNGVKEKCRQSGIYHYISKPFEPDYFIQTINKVIMENEEVNSVILQQSVGLLNMGNDSVLYRQVLKEYLNENKYLLDKLNIALTQKRYLEAAHILHKVKSSSGSIGATVVYNLSTKLQEALDNQNEDDILFLQIKFSKVFLKLLDEIVKFQDEI